MNLCARHLEESCSISSECRVCSDHELRQALRRCRGLLAMRMRGDVIGAEASPIEREAYAKACKALGEEP